MLQGLLSDRYYLKFGLDRDPFPQKFSRNRLFLTHELNTLMAGLQAAVRDDARIQVLEAEVGGGKSSLAHYLNYVKDPNGYLGLINATPALSPTELAHGIISQHFPSHRFEKRQAAALLGEFLQLYQRNDHHPGWDKTAGALC